MNGYISILRRHNVVRASAAAIFLYGFAGAATSPYQAVIAIKELGLSDQDYALIALAASVANVILAIAIGFLSDRFATYRKPLIFVSSFGILGYGMVWAIPTPISFALAMVGPLALFHATNSMLFGNVRAHSAAFAPEESAVVNALMRMMISLSWVLVPGIVGLMLSGQQSMIGSFAIAAVLSAAILAVVLFWLSDEKPKPNLIEGGTGTARVAPTAGRTDRPTQVRLARPAVFEELAQVLTLGLFLRVLGVAMISQVLHVNSAVMPLILIDQAKGEAGDIGYVIGIVALLEVIFMFFWSASLKRLHLTSALFITAALYLGYLAGVAMATAPWHIYAVSLLAGFAAAGIISLPISYLLDLISDRPGLSASLIAVNMFFGGSLGAGVFALGTHLGGYSLAAVLSGLAGVMGAALLVALERKAL